MKATKTNISRQMHQVFLAWGCFPQYKTWLWSNRCHHKCFLLQLERIRDELRSNLAGGRYLKVYGRNGTEQIFLIKMLFFRSLYFPLWSRE